MTRLMFLYESLSSYDKELINDEIARAIKKMILDIGSFNYSENDLDKVVTELSIRNKVIDDLIGGNSLVYYNLKATVIGYNALKIAYGIEQSKPSLERLKRLVELCVTLQNEVHTEMLFNGELVEKLIMAYECYIDKLSENSLKNVVDFDNIFNYNKSSNTIWFIETMLKLNKEVTHMEDKPTY